MKQVYYARSIIQGTYAERPCGGRISKVKPPGFWSGPKTGRYRIPATQGRAPCFNAAASQQETCLPLPTLPCFLSPVPYWPSPAATMALPRLAALCLAAGLLLAAAPPAAAVRGLQQCTSSASATSQSKSQSAVAEAVSKAFADCSSCPCQAQADASATVGGSAQLRGPAVTPRAPPTLCAAALPTVTDLPAPTNAQPRWGPVLQAIANAVAEALATVQVDVTGQCESSSLAGEGGECQHILNIFRDHGRTAGRVPALWSWIRQPCSGRRAPIIACGSCCTCSLFALCCAHAAGCTGTASGSADANAVASASAKASCFGPCNACAACTASAAACAAIRMLCCAVVCCEAVLCPWDTLGSSGLRTAAHCGTHLASESADWGVLRLVCRWPRPLRPCPRLHRCRPTLMPQPRRAVMQARRVPAPRLCRRPSQMLPPAPRRP